MYSEKTFKNYIFWIQVKRVFLMIILSIIGAALGILIGEILENTIKISSYNNIIIVISTLLFFVISLLLTSNIGKEVQDGYWKIAVLRKLTVIQKSLEVNSELLVNNKSAKEYKNISKKIKEEMLKELDDDFDNEIEEDEIIKDESDKNKQINKRPKVKNAKTLK